MVYWHKSYNLKCTFLVEKEALGGWWLCIQTFSLGSYLCYPRPELIRLHELVGVKPDPALFWLPSVPFRRFG
jgi:hypothetical protein